jgi:hypothetical protein
LPLFWKPLLLSSTKLDVIGPVFQPDQVSRGNPP